jgi:hypothetical protein
MTDNQDTWQTYSFTVNDPGLHFVRIIGRHDTGNLYYTVTVGYEYTGVGGAQVKPARGWRITDDRWDDIYRGIEGLWLFNDGSGTIVADASGHGRHGVANVTPPWSASPMGGCWANATGYQMYVTVSTAATWFPPADFTIVGSCRVLADSIVGLIGLPQAGPRIGCMIAWSTAGAADDKWRASIYNTIGGSTQSAGPQNDPAVGELATIALVLSGNVATFWQQGKQVDSDVLPGTRFVSATIPGPLWLCARTTNGTGPTHAQYNAVEWCAIWSRALSASEVRRLHEQPPWMVG